MTMLRILYLSSNHFKGVISPTILNSPNLLILDVQDNDLSGDIPEWLYDHPCLEVFHSSLITLLSGTRVLQALLTGMTVKKLVLQYTYLFQDDYIRSFIPSETQMSLLIKNRLYTFKGNPLLMMTEIDLSSNQLIGSVPSEMGELSQLRFLNFSINSLTGFIPISFQNLRSMESLDFSHNKLRGRIPSELVGLTSLSVFSVAYNNISGRYPFEHQFSTFTSQCYEGNLELCGDPLPRKCSTANQSEPKEKKGIRMIDHHFFFYAFVTVSYALGFWAFFGILNIKKNSRHKYFKDVDGYIESLFELLSKYR
ncbi:receptor-like protein 45 [Carya illinoinensis]|uniref:receptor-like protein 45 n=1 Tax=Carya illinoinensis TaxID=32201 RepID=UPI001C7263CD|nr:receptor-like protein 45 [Carya illinoinensis]